LLNKLARNAKLRDRQMNRTLRDTLLTALAPCVWGSTYIVTTELLPADHPLTSAVIRVLPVGIIMLAMTRVLPVGHWWWRLMVLGMLNIGVFQALLFVAAYRLPGGVAATLGAVQPLVVVLLSWFMLNAPHSRLTWLAAISGLIGVGLLVLGPAAKLDVVGIVSALIGAVCMGLGTVLTKHWKSPYSISVLTAWQLVFGGIFLLPLALLFEEHLHSVTLNNVIGYAYLGLIGSGLTYALWFRGIQRLPTAAVSILGLLSPLVATLLGYFILQQSLTVVQFLGAVLVLGSVWMGQFQNRAR
jgi:probable blue pigment (indigoidine) exporter